MVVAIPETLARDTDGDQLKGTPEAESTAGCEVPDPSPESHFIPVEEPDGTTSMLTVYQWRARFSSPHGCGT